MKITNIIFGILLLIFVVGITYAANEKATDKQTTQETPVKNMTYGQCVSQNAEIKNTCFSNIKTTLETCKSQATEKTATKQCDQTYKKDKDSCKKTFKDAKNECKKIKHNFLETMRYAFK